MPWTSAVKDVFASCGFAIEALLPAGALSVHVKVSGFLSGSVEREASSCTAAPILTSADDVVATTDGGLSAALMVQPLTVSEAAA